MIILILSNNASGLVSFRVELIEKMIEIGYEVYVSVPRDKYAEQLEKNGCIVLETKLSRHGINPIAELSLLRFYKKIVRTIKPNFVLTYTIKPNVYGGVACQKLRIPYIVNITGLGDSIENGGLMQKITLFLYRKGLKKAKHVFFQNQTNCDFFINKKIVKNNFSVLPGSGVNLQKHHLIQYPSRDYPIVFATIGRITKDKGINELLQAITVIKSKRSDVEFLLIGAIDDEKYKPVISEFTSKGLLMHIDFTDDVDFYIGRSYAVINPSYHEGMSNVLLEALSCGRPVLASNIPGCIETFDDKISGIAFEPKNVDSLVDGILAFLNLSYEDMKQMGLNGRDKVQKNFDRNIVIDEYFKVITD